MNPFFLQQPYGLPGDCVHAEPYGNGHINDTYAVRYRQAGTTVRYIHQRVNHHVFKNVPALMDNIHRVTTFIREQLLSRGQTDVSRRVLTLLETADGKPYHVDESGNYWRTYLFIEGATTHDRTRTPLQAREAARAFGEFQRLLEGLPGDRLHETIPDFHNTPVRFRNFERAIEHDAAGRVDDVRAEIDWFRKRLPFVDRITSALESGAISERITHNDTKLNNVMLDDATMEGICVIDLDTVMPGSALYDFGDLVRTAASTGNEDGGRHGNSLDLSMFEAIAGGYLSSAGGFLNDHETGLLAFCGKLITYETGLRFLTDHLEGDPYFKIHRPGQNLERCHSQMSLVESIEEQESRMEKIIHKEVAKCR